MSEKSITSRHPKLIIVAFNLFLIIGLLGLIEYSLRTFFPMTLNVAGFVRTENGRKYGWGFNPNQQIRIDDPDTGEIYMGHVNNHGWRDVDREFKKPQGVYRVLVLGDSGTFGYIVPTENVFTRVLEKRLRSEGYNIEILNMSYSGWGSHQQYEALRLEGVRYEPDLIIVKTTENDMNENEFFLNPGKTGRRIPFYYKLDENAQLKRHGVPEFERELKVTTRKHIISTSQILTRLWTLRNVWKRKTYAGYAVGKNTTFRLKNCVAPFGYEKFVDALAKFEGKPISEEELKGLIVKFQLDENMKAKVLRLTEDRPSNRDWQTSGYFTTRVYKEHTANLFTALLGQIHKLSRSIGAKFTVSVSRGRGSFNRGVSMCAISSSPENYYKYMQFDRLVKDFSHKQGTGFVDQLVPVTGARNDGHPNSVGNQEIAENYYQYLMKHHGEELRAHRIDK